MIDTALMSSILEKLAPQLPASLAICDVSGRVVVALDPALVGTLSLPAIEALNLNSCASFSERSDRPACAAVPLRIQHSRIGALVAEDEDSDQIASIELLGRSVSLLYEELLLSRSRQDQTQERSQFLYEWLHLQSDYSEAFQKRGEQLGIDISGTHTVILMQQAAERARFTRPLLTGLLGPRDISLPLSQNRLLLILREDDSFETRYRRVTAAVSGFRLGVCSGSRRLRDAFQTAAESLELGELLFPEETCHTAERMRFACALARLPVPGLEHDFALLDEKGKNAQLAETALAYIQANGDVSRLCQSLHIHRNNLSYRLRRIRELCGRDLTDSYDMMCLYASYIKWKRGAGET